MSHYITVLIFTSLAHSSRFFRYRLSHVMGKPAFCICENKGADQLRGHHAADQCLCFCYIDSTLFYFIHMKFEASSCLLFLYSHVCVGPVYVRIVFSCDTAQLEFQKLLYALHCIIKSFRKFVPLQAVRGSLVKRPICQTFHVVFAQHHPQDFILVP